MRCQRLISFLLPPTVSSMGTHVVDANVTREFMRSLRKPKPDFLFASFMLERDKFAIDSTDSGGWSTAMHAAKLGKLDVLKWLHHRNADMSKPDKSGHTPLHIAVANKNMSCIEFLVDTCGCDINAANTFGCTPGHWVAQNGDENMLRWFAEKGADLRALTIGMWRPEDYAKRIPFGGRLNGKYKKHYKCIQFLQEECAHHPGKGKFLIPAKKEDIARTKEEELRRRASVYKADQKMNFEKNRLYPKALYGGQENDMDDLESLHTNNNSARREI